MLIFDEPVNGMDPEGVCWARGLFRQLAAEGRTVFLSSHLIGEMVATADDIVVIGQGRLLAAGSVDDLAGSGGSLEDAFLALTATSVDYRSGGSR